MQHATRGGGVCAPAASRSCFHAPVLPCAEAPLSESSVQSVATGAEARRTAGALVLGGAGRGWGGVLLTKITAMLRLLSVWIV